MTSPNVISSLATNMLSSFGGQSIVVKEIFDAIKGSENDPKSLVLRLLTSMPRVLLMIAINHYVTNSADLGALLKRVLMATIKILIYRRLILAKSEPANLITFQARAFDREVQEEATPTGMMVESTDRMVSVYHLPRIHQQYIDGILSQVETEFNQTDGATKLFYYSGGSYRTQPLNQFFPSRNYQRLEAIVRARVDVSQLTQNYQVLGVLINGDTGLGKSEFARYAATLGFLGSVYRADLSRHEMITKTPEVLIRSIFHDIPVSHSTLVVIDEMDKWLDFHIRESYRTKNNARPANTEPLDLEAYVKEVKQDFLLALLGIFERNNLAKPCVVIFCCNNFDTIFSNIDTTHFESLKDRFMRITFEQCQRDEICDFLRYYNHCFLNDPKYYDPNLEDHLQLLRADICLTYRSLIMLINHEMYNFSRIVTELNRRSNTPLSSPKVVGLDLSHLQNSSPPASSSSSSSPPASSAASFSASSSDTSSEAQIVDLEQNDSDDDDSWHCEECSAKMKDEGETLCRQCGEKEDLCPGCGKNVKRCDTHPLNQITLDASNCLKYDDTLVCEECYKGRIKCSSCDSGYTADSIQDGKCLRCFTGEKCSRCGGYNSNYKMGNNLCEKCGDEQTLCHTCHLNLPLTHYKIVISQQICQECAIKNGGIKIDSYPIPMYSCRGCGAKGLSGTIICECPDCQLRVNPEPRYDNWIYFSCHYCLHPGEMIPAPPEDKSALNQLVKVTREAIDGVTSRLDDSRADKIQANLAIFNHLAHTNQFHLLNYPNTFRNSMRSRVFSLRIHQILDGLSQQDLEVVDQVLRATNYCPGVSLPKSRFQVRESSI